MELLIASGASINSHDAIERTPLHFAASGGHVRIAERLMSHGADPNARTSDKPSKNSNQVGVAWRVWGLGLGAFGDERARFRHFFFFFFFFLLLLLLLCVCACVCVLLI